MNTETKVEEKRCARCNGKSSKEWFKVSGLTVGLECRQEVEAVAKSTGKKGEKLLNVVRDDYKAMMRQTTVTGMILIGMLSLDDMISKGKITNDQFLACAKKRYRGDDAKRIIGGKAKKRSKPTAGDRIRDTDRVNKLEAESEIQRRKEE